MFQLSKEAGSHSGVFSSSSATSVSHGSAQLGVSMEKLDSLLFRTDVATSNNQVRRYLWFEPVEE